MEEYSDLVLKSSGIGVMINKKVELVFNDNEYQGDLVAVYPEFLCIKNPEKNRGGNWSRMKQPFIFISLGHLEYITLAV